ncbi:MAG: hypothetical protein M3300_10275, partial [Actinomycetota bacterium]|nr:hypothetical protein [Actinomycetota bacterium]
TELGPASGQFTGQAFVVQQDGTLRCPADKILRLQERRAEADGTLRLVSARSKRIAVAVRWSATVWAGRRQVCIPGG